MIKMKLGTLVRMKVNIDLLDGCSVCIGDHGIIIENNIILSDIHRKRYDYKILINTCEIMVFSEEIEEAS